MGMRKTFVSTVLMATLLLLTMAVQAPAETLRPKVDNFILFFDQSGSMVLTSADWSGLKLKMAKELAGEMNAEIPELGYTSGVNTFAPFDTQLAPTRFTRAAVAAAIKSIDAGYDPYGRNTPLGFGLDKIDPVLGTMKGKTALIVFTDGNSNYGIDPVAEAQALYSKYPNLCIHIVSYADKDHGKEVVSQIRALNNCSVVGDPVVMGSEVGLRKFVRDVFYGVVLPEAAAPAPVRAMTPVSAKAECETITLGNMNFAFDKYMITTEMMPALEQALSVLKGSTCSKFIIEGHTDSVGTVPYNQGLSERRANSVAKWLIEKGYKGNLVVEGKGKLSPKFDNNNAEGRYLNRRVEIRNN